MVSKQSQAWRLGIQAAVMAGLNLTPLQGQETVDRFSQGTNAFSLTFATVGDPGNPNDPVFTYIAGGIGGVGYTFRMGKHALPKGTDGAPRNVTFTRRSAPGTLIV